MDEILVSDNDRNAVVSQLQKHTADGRLTIDEFSERVDEAYRARTASDLRAVLRNLPPLVMPTPSVVPRPDRTRRHGRPRGASPFTFLLALAFILIGVWTMTGWFPFPLVIVAFIWTGHRRRHAYHH